MSIALDSTNRIEGSGFMRGLSCMIFDTPEKPRQQITGTTIIPILSSSDQIQNQRMLPIAADDENDEDCCSSSSIGRNSEDEEEDDGEVQSSLKGPLDTLDALEDSLPTKKGISQFYSGKSKSFTSLADATSSSSVQDIAKPDNRYTRKRKNLLATSIMMMDRSQSNPNFQRPLGGGIPKRPASSRRSTFSPAGTPTSSSESIHSENSNSSSSPPPPSRLPPLHPQQPRPSPNSIAWTSQPSLPSRRAFSYSDLQTAGSDSNSSSSTSNKDENDKKHH
ncbi:hypothetical protein ACHQM5_001667 [Ranunculus cassubicifolius]